MYIFDNEILKTTLKEKNMKQKELADQTHISEDSISRYISGERTPNINSLFKICEVLQLPPTHFIVRL